VQLPIAVRQQIEDRAEALGFAALKRAAAALSDAYREGRTPRLGDAERTAAYLVTRMPATFAAAHAVLDEVAARVDAIGSGAETGADSPATFAAAHDGAIRGVLDAGAGTGADSSAAHSAPRAPGAIRSVLDAGAGTGADSSAAHSAPRAPGAIRGVLDAGAGTGAASLAARAHFPHAAITMVERDGAFARAARQWLPDAALIAADIARPEALPPHDLVIAAYSLGEFGAPLAARLWQAARVALVLIEPGTPRGFALIRKARGELLAAGARMVAPCPAETECPMADPDWCHFAARVERSSLHRRVKGGELGYEDEKYSYVVLVRQAVELPAARIVRHPQHRPGLVTIETCTPAGLRRERIGRADRERFRAARKAVWGSAGIS
jgi:ribosomal protein RSM22 (predicted rRNA methylase)